MAGSETGRPPGSGRSPPTAPPLATQPPLDVASSSGSSSRYSSTDGSLGLAPTAPKADLALYRELEQRANGDQQLLSIWLAEMGFHQPAGVQLQQEQQQSIKAVGTHGTNSMAAWGSLVATAGTPSKAQLKSSTATAAVNTPPPAPGKDLDSQAADAGAPGHFFCPISLNIMRDPVVVAATGQTYDRPCIQRWLQQGNNSCPATGLPLTPPVSLVDNVALRNSIEEWAEKHAPWLLGSDRRVKPLPKEEQFAALPPPRPTQAQAQHDPDLALAIQLQQEELQRIAMQRQQPYPQQPMQGPAPYGVPYGAAPLPAAAMAGAPASARPAAMSIDSSRQGGGSSRGAGTGHARQRQRWCSPITLLLGAITAAYIALFIVSLAKNSWNIENLAVNPWAGASQAALMDVGAQEAQAVASGGQWWRLFTSPFVNAGTIQMLLNMSCMWTFARTLEGMLLPYPAASMAAIYLLGAWVGALASANLNYYYITCGGSAGICALLGAVWADQLVNRRRYVSQLWTVLVLSIISAIYITMSLLPLLDPWYQAAALLAGFLVGTALLLVPRVAGRRRRSGSGRYLAMQCLCAFLVIAGATVGAVGIALNARVGANAAFLEDASCVGFGQWQCLTSSSSPNGCLVEVQDSGSRTLYCPSGESHDLPAGTAISPGDTDFLSQLCSEFCGSDAGFSEPPASGGSPGGPSPSSPPAGSGGGGSGSGVLMSVGTRD